MKRQTALFLLFVLCASLLPDRARGWGNEGHLAINRTAARKIPKEMPGFFRRAGKRLEYFGPEPDRWRGRGEPELKNAQEPDHFLDSEMLEGFGELPPTRYQFIRWMYEKREAERAAGRSTLRFGKELYPENVGLQPYAALEVYGRLKSAFREYRRLKSLHQYTRGAEDAAVFYAGWLGHYVADASQPLHTTVHYNGWLESNPKQYSTSKNVHADFETRFVSRNLARLEFDDLVQKPVRVEHPFPDYVRYIHDSNGLVEKLYQLEKTGGFADPGTPEGLEFVRGRLAIGSQMLANLWYTAWLESGEPEKPAATPAN